MRGLTLPALAAILLAGSIASPPVLETASGATIRRDTYGVPHILASTEALAAEAHGYATAEDHVELLARAFVRAKGRSAAIFGERALQSDLAIEQFEIYSGARERFASLPATTRGILDGYAAGYNRYLARHRQTVPAWAEPITGVDVLAHCRAVILLDFSLDLRQWSRLAPAASEAPPSSRGSNAWGIGRQRSASGRGILFANPHLPWVSTFLFHEVHLTVPGVINVYGASLIGFPVVAIGFNEHLGWTHTVNRIDADDLYELTLDPADPMRYIYDGAPRPLREKTIELPVKTATGVQTGTHRLLWSHLGPAIRTGPGRAVSLKSANLDQVSFLTQWNTMGKARSLQTFMTALDQQALPMFNIVYADRAGRTFYLFNGRIPVRRAPLDWSGIVPGNTSANEWRAIHPVKDLPQLTDPPGGYVQNSNDAPWYTTPHRLLNPGDFPSYFDAKHMAFRGQAGVRLLESDPRIELDEVLRYAFDNRLEPAERFKDELIALAADARDSSLQSAIETLRAWDNRTESDRRGAVLFGRWWERYSKDAKPAARTAWTADDPYRTPKGIGDPAAAVRALRDAAAELTREHGRVDVDWGDRFRFRRGKLDLPLNAPPNRYGAFRAVEYRKDEDGRFVATSGDSFVLAVEFAEPVRAYTVLSYSQSSRPESPHYNDQGERFARGQLKPVWFSDRAIDAHLERSYPVGSEPSQTPSASKGDRAHEQR